MFTRERKREWASERWRANERKEYNTEDRQGRGPDDCGEEARVKKETAEANTMARSGPGVMCGSDGVCEGEHAGFGRRQWRDVLAVGADSRRGHSAARQQRPKSPCTDRDPRGARRYFIMIIVMHAGAPASRTTLDFGNPLAYQYSTVAECRSAPESWRSRPPTIAEI